MDMDMGMDMDMEMESRNCKRKDMNIEEMESCNCKRKRVMDGEIEEDRFLLFGSDLYLICIDLKKTEEKYGASCSQLPYDDGTPVAEAEVVWSTHIHGIPIPLGMTCTRYNFLKPSPSPSPSVLVPCSSKILLIGGELQNPSSSPFVSTHASREVYKLVPEITNAGDIKDIKIEVADVDIPRMNGAKSCPIVEEIRGNLYVLHTQFLYRGYKAPDEIPFEVFDSKTGKWRELPIPPCFASGTGAIIYDHAVIGNYIAIMTSEDLASFDTLKEEWCDPCSVHLFTYPMTVFSIPISGLPSCFGLEGQGQGFYVGFSLRIEPCAYLLAPNGTCLARQPLAEVIYKDMLPDPERLRADFIIIPLKSTQDNVIRMCACSKVLSNDNVTCLLLVSFFSAKISPSSQQLMLIYKNKMMMISGELPPEDTVAHFLDVFVEKKFVLSVPYLGCSIYGPALLL